MGSKTPHSFGTQIYLYPNMKVLVPQPQGYDEIVNHLEYYVGTKFMLLLLSLTPASSSRWAVYMAHLGLFNIGDHSENLYCA